MLDITELQKSVHMYWIIIIYGEVVPYWPSALSPFCQKLHCSPLPTKEQLLLLFVAHLANEGVAHSTIKVYLSSIRNHHLATGHHQTFASQLTPRVEQALQGVKRTQASQSAPIVCLHLLSS